jgi:acetyl esterase/lipase
MPILPKPIDLLNATVDVDGLSIVEDIPYGPSPRQTLDVYRLTAARGKLPVLVWFYGGAWRTGARHQYRFLAAPLARRGVLVVVPDYRLFPEVRYPDFVEDGARAVALARRLAWDFGADPSCMFVAGHSAGAYIAAMLALNPRYLAAAGDARERLAGAVGIAGPYDFLPITGADVREVFAPAADDLPPTQPINHVDGRNPNLLLLHGDADATCYPRNALALAARIRAAGGPVAVRTYPGVGHIGIVAGFAALLRFRSPALADVSEFIGGTLAATAGRAIRQPA